MVSGRFLVISNCIVIIFKKAIMGVFRYAENMAREAYETTVDPPALSNFVPQVEQRS